MSLPVDLGETQDRSGKKLLISKKDGVHKVLLFNERNLRCTVRLKLCRSQAWGKENRHKFKTVREGKV